MKIIGPLMVFTRGAPLGKGCFSFAMLNSNTRGGKIIRSKILPGHRCVYITQQRSAYDALRRALQNPQDAKNQKRAAYVIWNSGRKGKRKPPMFHPKHWSLAIRVGREDPTIRLTAVRWHLGNFPLGTDGSHSDSIRLHNMKIHALMKIKPEHVTRQHVADLENIITQILQIRKNLEPHLIRFV